MDVQRWEVHYAWDGPLHEVCPPDEILYDVTLRLRGASLDAVAQALTPLAGQPRRGWNPLGPRLRWTQQPYTLAARPRKETLEIASGTRLRPRPLRRIIDALATVPGAHDLEIDATVPHYSPPHANLRACSPCQAGRFR